MKKFEFEHSRAKVKITVVIFRQTLCHYSSAFIYTPILILYLTNAEYDNTLDKFEFEHSKAKVKVTAAIFRKNIVIALVPSFIIQFQYNFTQVLGMTIPQISSHFNMIGLRSRLQ